MELFDILDDELDEFFDRVTRSHRHLVYRERPKYNMDILDAPDFRSRFRLSKEAVLYIYSRIKNDISTLTDRNQAISPINRLLLTLRYYATGSLYTLGSDFTRPSVATASRIVHTVTHAIACLQPQFIKFPNDTQVIQQDFNDMAKFSKFPKLIGAIDCTHVQIKSPGGDKVEDFKNSKGQFSFKVQTLVSAKLRIMDMVYWPGASHKQNIFNNSIIKQKFINGEFGDCVIVGNTGYQNTSYLLTPLENPETPAEHLYNESLITSREVVERTHAVWKNRFPVLSKKILLHISKVPAVIVACAVLHNIAIDMNEEQFEVGADLNDVESDVNIQTNKNMTDDSVRNDLINGYFASVLN